MLAAMVGIPVVGLAGVAFRSVNQPTPQDKWGAATTEGALSQSAASPEQHDAADIIARYEQAKSAQWGWDLEGITQAVPNPNPHQHTLALTFDACGGPRGSAVDAQLISTLREYDIPATLFLNKRWVQKNLAEAKRLAADPLFQIENHGTSHRPLSISGRSAYGISGTTSVAEVVDEIEGNRDFLQRTLGVEPTWFRSGTAHYDDVAVKIVRDLGLGIAGFRVSGDEGATAPSYRVTEKLLSAPATSIVIMHMNQPASGTASGVAGAIPQMLATGCNFVKLGKAPTSR